MLVLHIGGGGTYLGSTADLPVGGKHVSDAQVGCARALMILEVRLIYLLEASMSSMRTLAVQDSYVRWKYVLFCPWR